MLIETLEGPVLLDVDDTIIEVHGYAKQGVGFGYTKVRGLNALLATVTTCCRSSILQTTVSLKMQIENRGLVGKVAG